MVALHRGIPSFWSPRVCPSYTAKRGTFHKDAARALDETGRQSIAFPVVLIPRHQFQGHKFQYEEMEIDAITHAGDETPVSITCATKHDIRSTVICRAPHAAYGHVFRRYGVGARWLPAKNTADCKFLHASNKGMHQQGPYCQSTVPIR